MGLINVFSQTTQFVCCSLFSDDESVAGNLLLYGGPATDQDLYQKVSLLRAELKLVGDDRDSLNLNNNPPNLNMASQDKVNLC